MAKMERALETLTENMRQHRESGESPFHEVDLRFLSFETLGRVLDDEGVAVEFEDGTKATGFWQWHGQTGEDFYLVYINDLEGEVIIGTDVRNITKVTVL